MKERFYDRLPDDMQVRLLAAPPGPEKTEDGLPTWLRRANEAELSEFKKAMEGRCTVASCDSVWTYPQSWNVREFGPDFMNEPDRQYLLRPGTFTADLEHYYPSVAGLRQDARLDQLAADAVGKNEEERRKLAREKEMAEIMMRASPAAGKLRSELRRTQQQKDDRLADEFFKKVGAKGRIEEGSHPVYVIIGDDGEGPRVTDNGVYYAGYQHSSLRHIIRVARARKLWIKFFLADEHLSTACCPMMSCLHTCCEIKKGERKQTHFTACPRDCPLVGQRARCKEVRWPRDKGDTDRHEDSQQRIVQCETCHRLFQRHASHTIGYIFWHTAVYGRHPFRPSTPDCS